MSAYVKYFQPTVAASSAGPTPGSSWATTRRPWCGFGGEARQEEPEDLSGNLIVQLGTVTEELNRHWYERNTGQVVKDVQRQVQHPVIKWMAATLDGLVEGTGAVFEAKFMLPWTFSEEAAAEKHMAQLQHNMWVANARTAVLSIITGGRQMGRDDHPCRLRSINTADHRREEVLALREERGDAAAVRG